MIVHHDRLLPVVDTGFRNKPIPNSTSDVDIKSSESELSDDSEFSYSDSDSSTDDKVENGALNRQQNGRDNNDNYQTSSHWVHYMFD